MLCDICKKNPATIHLQEIVNGKQKTFHLCAACAAKKASAGENLLNGFNLAEVLFNLTKAMKEEKPEKEKFPVIVCPECGWELSHFQKTGYLGCPSCYQTFSEQLQGVIRNMHRGEVHTGKTPGTNAPDAEERLEKNDLRRKLAECRRELQAKIRAEEYELAALLRDRIAEMEKQLGENS